MCKGVTLKVQDIVIQQNLFGFRGADIALRWEWLTGLGEIANFDDLTLKLNGQMRVLKAEPELIKTLASIKLVKGVWQDQGQGFIFELNHIADQPAREIEVAAASIQGV